MKNLKILSLIFLFIGVFLSFGQSQTRFVVEDGNDASISFVNIMFQENNRGATSNENGLLTVKVNERGIKEIKRLVSEKEVKHVSFPDLIENDDWKSEVKDSTLHGTIVDENNEPISFANVMFKKSNRATITNENGRFRILANEAELDDSLTFSHIGYDNKELSVSEIKVENDTVILKKIANNSLSKDLIEKSALSEIKKVLKSISINFPQESHLLTGFYNEQMQHEDGRVFDYAEGILQLLKEKYLNNPTEESVYYSNSDAGIKKLAGFYEIFYMYLVLESDNTYAVPGIMAGGSSPIIMDVLKNVESYLLKNNIRKYKWEHNKMTIYGNQLAKVISFEPKNNNALFKGEVFIGVESDAILYTKFEVVDLMLSKLNEADYWVDILSKVYEVEYRQRDSGYILGSAKINTKYKQKLSGEIFNYSMNYVTTDCEFNTKEVINYLERIDNAQKLSPFKGQASNFGMISNVIKRTEKVRRVLDQTLINREKNIAPILVYAGKDSIGPIVDYGQIIPVKIEDFSTTMHELESSRIMPWRNVRGVLLTLILDASESTELEKLGRILIKNRRTAIDYEWQDLRALILYKQGNKQKAFVEQQDILMNAKRVGIFYRTTLHIYKDRI